MKQKTNQTYQPLNVVEVTALCTETKEAKLNEKQLKSFSVVDLWFIQKSVKSSALRHTITV